MPIKVLEKVRRPPVAGYAKLGGREEKERTAKSGRKWRAPVKFNEFRMVRLQRDNKTGNYVMDARLQWILKAWNAGEEKQEAFEKAKTAKEKADIVREVPVREIPIYLASDDLDECLETDYVYYRGTVLQKKCDGERCESWLVRNVDGAYKRVKPESKIVDCMCPKYPDTGIVNPHGNGTEICSPSARLSFFVAIPDAAATLGACYQFRTKGWNSIRRLRGSLMGVRAMVGKLTGVPLVLVASEVVTKDAEGKTRKFLAAHVECRVDVSEAINGARTLHESRQRLSLIGDVRSEPSESEAEIRRRDEQDAPEYHPDQTHPEEHREYEMEQNEDGEFEVPDSHGEDELFPPEDGEVYDPPAPDDVPIEQKQKVVKGLWEEYRFRAEGSALGWMQLCEKLEVDADAFESHEALEVIGEWLHTWLSNNPRGADKDPNQDDHEIPFE